MVKPFDSEVLLMKIRAMLSRRSARADTDQEFVIGGYRFRSSTRMLSGPDESEVRLSPKGAALLTLLCQHRNEVLTRSSALKLIWNDDNYFTGRSMDVYIARLRKALAGDPTVQIGSVPGNGYTLRVREK